MAALRVATEDGRQEKERKAVPPSEKVNSSPGGGLARPRILPAVARMRAGKKGGPPAGSGERSGKGNSETPAGRGKRPGNRRRAVGRSQGPVEAKAEVSSASR